MGITKRSGQVKTGEDEGILKSCSKMMAVTIADKTPAWVQQQTCVHLNKQTNNFAQVVEFVVSLDRTLI